MDPGPTRHRSDFGAFLLLAALAGCAHEPPPLTVPHVAGSEVPVVASTPGWGAPPTGGASSGGAIDAVIYANLSNDEMLRRLAPYVAGFGTREGFEKAHGASPCSGMGPGAAACTVPGSGLELIYDPNGVLRLMRRQARTLGGRSYAASPLTGPGFRP